MQLDIVLRRTWRRIRDAVPGPTIASRLARRRGTWRHAPPHQRAEAYTQYLQTQRQLHQHHIQLKILPKIIDVLFIGLKSHLAAPIGQLMLLILIGCVIGWLFF